MASQRIEPDIDSRSLTMLVNALSRRIRLATSRNAPYTAQRMAST
jgi:hypothetical protein